MIKRFLYLIAMVIALFTIIPELIIYEIYWAFTGKRKSPFFEKLKEPK